MASAERTREKVFRNATGYPTLTDVAELIKDGKVKNLIIMAGAGTSTSCGIPDFRSPETGLYANLAKYSLPYPEAIFQIDYFKRKPEPFFALAKELHPDSEMGKKIRPGRTHFGYRMWDKKGILTRVFTQNIDTLERLTGLPDSKIVEAHGSFASSRCILCKKEYDNEKLGPKLTAGEVVRCERAGCKGRSDALVKPDIVFFGEGLPKRFFQLMPDFKKCDLLIVLGTSLQVQPFASLIDEVPSTCPRVLINLESVGEMEDFSFGGGMFGRYREGGFDFEGRSRGGREYARDVRWLGETDKGVTELMKLCGWGDEFEDLVKKGRESLNARLGPSVAPSAQPPPTEEPAAKEPEGEAAEPEPVAKIPPTTPGRGVASAKAAQTAKEVGKAVETEEDGKEGGVDELVKGVEKVEIGQDADEDTAKAGKKEEKKAAL